MEPATQIELAKIFGKTLTSLGICGFGGIYIWKNVHDDWFWSMIPLLAPLALIGLLWGIDISKIIG